MPLFEYKCTDCSSIFEQLVRSARNSQEIICPACKGTETQKLLSGFAVVGGSAPSGMAAADCTPGGT